MNNKALIITTIIFLIIIILFLVLIMFMAINHRFRFGNWTQSKNNVIFDTNYEISEINDLTILSSMGNIKFKENEDNKIHIVVLGENNEDVSVNLENRNLQIDYSNYKTRHIFWGFNSFKRDITVYIPKNYEGQISLNTSYGDVEIIDLENVTINIDSDCGNVKLGKIKNVLIDSNYGDVDIENILNKVSIKSDCGNVKIASLTIMEASSIESNFGNIKIGKTNDIFIDAKTDLGNVKITNNNRYSDITLKLLNVCGDIKVEN